MECESQSTFQLQAPPIVNISEGKIQFRNKMFYREKTTPSGTTYWRCVEKECYGRLNVDIIGEVEERRNQHNCLISEFDCLKEKCKDEIRRYACDNLSIGPVNVIATVKAKYSCDVSNSLPNTDTLCRAIQRWRSPKGIKQHNSRRARDAALEKLKQLTLLAESDMKGIDLVRKVLNEMPPEAKHLMPTEENLRKKVARWAKQGGISLTRSTLNDYIPNEESNTQNTKAGTFEAPTNSSGMGNKEQEASCSNLTENASLEPGTSSNNSNKSGVFFLKGKKVDGHWRAMIKGQIYHWRKGIPGRGKSFYECREARTGCPVTAVIYEDNQFEVSGKHTHKYDKSQPKVKAGRWLLGLKRVDDDGNELGPASMDSIPYREMDGGLSSANDNLHNLSLPLVDPVQSEDFINATNSLLDDDFHIDLDIFQESSTNETMSHTKQWKSNDVVTRKPVKSGERCFVCGDELIDSETLDSNTETFRKACCYLNVRSDSNWFPRNPNLGCYSFCDSCTKEIIRIHDLYKKVDEIMSLIFKKVENVEKRIVDAEIIDNWLSDAPHSSVVRFEGFRKQVMINYKNKLKLRREIRLGKKFGTNFVEVQPGSSAHMFASDPSETDAFRKLPKLNMGGETTRKIPRAMPKSQRLRLERNLSPFNNRPFASPMLPGSPSCDEHFVDDNCDTVSVVSEKELKFWQEDPSKLVVDQNDALNSNYVNDDADDAWDQEEQSDSDCTKDDDDDKDYELSKKSRTKRKRKTKSANVKKALIRVQENQNVETLPDTDKSTQKRPAKLSKVLSRKPHSHNIEFPDAVVTKDNRIFMQGYEIIKLPPGKYSRRPYSESFSCGTCGKMALNLWKIRQHICGHHLGLFRCHICEKKFSEPRQILRHIEVKHSERKPKDCEICGRPICGEEQSMKYHIWTHFSEEERNDPQYKSYRPPREKLRNKPKSPNDSLQTFQCCHCGKTFMQPSSLRRHEICHSSGVSKVEKVQCQCCGNFYVHQKALAAHMQRCPATDNVSRRMYPCPKCLMRFKNRGSLNRHLKKHDTNMPYSCPKCPRRFNSKSGFRQHRRICTESTNPRMQSIPTMSSPPSVPLSSVSPLEETVRAPNAPPEDKSMYSNFNVPTYFGQAYN